MFSHSSSLSAQEEEKSSNRALMHSAQNQLAYNEFWEDHSKLSFYNSTKFLSLRDLFQLIDKYLLQNCHKTTYRILDYGCGNGETVKIVGDLLIKCGKDVELHCIDINANNLAVAKKTNPDAKFYLADQHHFSLEQNDFDLVLCNFVLLENLQPALVKILENIQSVLGEQGIAIVTHNTAKAYDIENQWVSFDTKFDQNKREFYDQAKNKFTREDGQLVKKDMLKDGIKLFTFCDFFYRRRTYKHAFEAAKLNLIATHKPLGTSQDHIAWKSEISVAPYRIDILQRSPTPSLQQSIFKTP